MTPCDHAERHHHTELALSLESQMVFSSSSAQESNTDAHAETNLLQYKEVRQQARNLRVPCWLDLYIYGAIFAVFLFPTVPETDFFFQSPQM